MSTTSPAAFPAGKPLYPEGVTTALQLTAGAVCCIGATWFKVTRHTAKVVEGAVLCDGKPAYIGCLPWASRVRIDQKPSPEILAALDATIAAWQQRQATAHAKRQQSLAAFRPGQRVSFKQRDGSPTYGHVTTVNAKTVTVVLEGDGTHYRVTPGLLTDATLPPSAVMLAPFPKAKPAPAAKPEGLSDFDDLTAQVKAMSDDDAEVIFALLKERLGR